MWKNDCRLDPRPDREQSSSNETASIGAASFSSASSTSYSSQAEEIQRKRKSRVPSLERAAGDALYSRAMRILLIEDEKKMAAFLAKGLEEANYEVETARDGETGLQLARVTRYDLLLVDVMLPKKDGWTVVEELRGTGFHTPILFLSARDSVPDRVKGLELGADDYLVKPFAFSELLARVRSVLRRAPAQDGAQLRVEDLELDLHRHRALRAGVELNLTAKEFLLLAHLARSAGEVVSRQEIAGQVWGIDFQTGTNVLDVMVRRLRAKVDDPFPKKLIHTVRGAGYVLKPG